MVFFIPDFLICWLLKKHVTASSDRSAVCAPSYCATTIADAAPTLPSNSTTAPAFNLQQQHPFQAVAAAIAVCHCSRRSHIFPLPCWPLPPQSPFAAAAAVAVATAVAVAAVPCRPQLPQSPFFFAVAAVSVVAVFCCICCLPLQLPFATAVAAAIAATTATVPPWP